MPGIWIDLRGPIVGTTAYDGGKLVGRDVTVNLPAVTPVAADFKAMGTLTLPVPGQIEAMEATITKIGVDLGLRSLVKMDSKTIEYRWAQNVVHADGTQTVEGCKAFLRSVSKGIPGISLEPGSSSENELAFAVSRYQLFVAGVEFWLIDQLGPIQRIDGKDYAKDLVSLL